MITDVDFSSIATTVLCVTAIVTSLLAFRASVKLNINQILDRLRKRKINQLSAEIRESCPHFVVDFAGDDRAGWWGMSSLYDRLSTKVGAWQCHNCGHVTYVEANMHEQMQYWHEHQEALNRQWRIVSNLEHRRDALM